MSGDKTPERTRADYQEKLGDELGKIFDLIRSEWCELRELWTAFENLFASGPERVELMNSVSGNFFGRVDRYFFEAAILAICRLTDPALTGRNKNLSLKQLPDLISDQEIKEEVERLIQAADLASEFQRDWRNRRISHNDFDVKSGSKTLESATLEKMNKAIDAIHAPIRHIGLKMMDTEMHDEVIGAVSSEISLLQTLYVGMDVREDL